MEEFKQCTISIKNIITFINEGARNQKINHQEAQLLRAAIMIEYGKHLRKEIGQFDPVEIPTFMISNQNLNLGNKGTYSNGINKDYDHSTSSTPSLLSCHKGAVIVRPSNLTNNK